MVHLSNAHELRDKVAAAMEGYVAGRLVQRRMVDDFGTVIAVYEDEGYDEGGNNYHVVRGFMIGDQPAVSVDRRYVSAESVMSYLLDNFKLGGGR